jgi:hypothetical protein
MPILYTHSYPRELFTLNPRLMCVYIESHTKRGGDPATVQVRGLERSLPLTLKENFSSKGHLMSDTEMRDTRLIESEFRVITNHLRQGVTVCLPTLLLAKEIMSLEKRTPKVEQYLSRRLNEVKEAFPLLEL